MQPSSESRPRPRPRASDALEPGSFAYHAFTRLPMDVQALFGVVPTVSMPSITGSAVDLAFQCPQSRALEDGNDHGAGGGQ